MGLAYDLLVTAFTAIFLSFLVAKLVSLALSSGDGGGGRAAGAAVDNGDRQSKGPVAEAEKRLRVEGSKSRKKKVKKISAETVLVSEFKGESEPPAADAVNFGGSIEADDLADDCEKLGSVDRAVEFPVKNEGLLISSCANPLNQRVVEEIGFSEEVGCPIEGLGQEANLVNDLGKLTVNREVDSVDHVDEVVKERIERKEDEIDDQDEHQRVLESEERVDVQKEEVISGNEEKGEMEISDGEEWEGIDRNELVSDFAKAVRFVECEEKEGGLDKLGSDVILQFYGLQKAAMEGPCHEPQSTALKLSARAMWNAWQNFGSMNPEEAMEKYITLLSDKFPGWMDGHSSLQGKINSEEDEACSSLEAKLNKPITLTQTCTNESKLGVEPIASSSDLAGISSSVNKDEE